MLLRAVKRMTAPRHWVGAASASSAERFKADLLAVSWVVPSETRWGLQWSS